MRREQTYRKKVADVIESIVDTQTPKANRMMIRHIIKELFQRCPGKRQKWIAKALIRETVYRGIWLYAKDRYIALEYVLQEWGDYLYTGNKEPNAYLFPYQLLKYPQNAELIKIACNWLGITVGDIVAPTEQTDCDISLPKGYSIQISEGQMTPYILNRINTDIHGELESVSHIGAYTWLGDVFKAYEM